MALGDRSAPSEPDGSDAPIDDYALIGDGCASALIRSNGSIDWWCLPHDERIAIFHEILDPAGGSCRLGPAGPVKATRRRYLPDTAVLETTHECETGTLVVTDCFTLHNGARLPWVEMARRVECTAGRVDAEWSVEPTMVLGADRHAPGHARNMLIAEEDDLRLGILTWDLGEPVVGSHGVSGTTNLVAGDTGLMAMVLVSDQPLPRPDRAEIEARIDRTVDTWRTWSVGVRYDDRWVHQVRTSARVLKLLVHEATGAILAAPTTSLPERAGGDLNYDYRYCWIRDASFTIDALLRIGLVEEAHAAIGALLRDANATAPDLWPFYRLDGDVSGEVVELDLRGHWDSRPVRCGNSAAHQLQLGSWGELFESVWIYVRVGNEIARSDGELLTSLADGLCERWRDPDSGIWELPTTEHYTISKLGAWRALDRAVQLVEADQLDGDVERWVEEREAIRAFVEQRCVSDGVLRFHADTERLDAACLLASRFGFLDGDDPRMLATIDAVVDELAEGPWVWRYSGRRTEEGAFLACSFWWSEALTRAGRLDDAADVIDATLEAANDVGLLAEQYDPNDGRLLGNHPQGLSHLAMVNAASIHTEMRGRVRDTAGR